MYQLVAVAAVAGLVAATFARRLVFTPGAQLRSQISSVLEGPSPSKPTERGA